jgi:hypothetical protein
MMTAPYPSFSSFAASCWRPCLASSALKKPRVPTISPKFVLLVSNAFIVFLSLSRLDHMIIFDQIYYSNVTVFLDKRNRKNAPFYGVIWNSRLANQSTNGMESKGSMVFSLQKETEKINKISV